MSVAISSSSPSSGYNTLRKKAQKKGVQFTMMVCGASGTGRTTFVNTLCGQQVLTHEAMSTGLQSRSSISSSTIIDHYSTNHANGSGHLTRQSIEGPVFDPSKAHLEKGIKIIPVTVDIDEGDGTRVSLTVVDTPGFGDNLDNEQCFGIIMSYLESQYDEILAEESRIRRNPRFKDNRVHLLLYFIEPGTKGLKELDVELMKRLSKRVNIIPVIGRADSLTSSELTMAKRMIMDDIEHYNIPVYNFPYDAEEDDAETIEENSQLKAMMPFAVVTSTNLVPLPGSNKLVRGRQYPWGVIDIENPRFSDYSYLRAAILGTHLADLKDLTHDFLYETYRTEKLSRNMSDPRESTLLNPEDLANQSYIIKEEQLAREEEKLREIELRVQREINQKRMELIAREQELRDIEARIAKERSTESPSVDTESAKHLSADEKQMAQYAQLQQQQQQQQQQLQQQQQQQQQLQQHQQTVAQAQALAQAQAQAQAQTETGQVPYQQQQTQDLQRTGNHQRTRSTSSQNSQLQSGSGSPGSPYDTSSNPQFQAPKPNRMSIIPQEFQNELEGVEEEDYSTNSGYSSNYRVQQPQSQQQSPYMAQQQQFSTQLQQQQQQQQQQQFSPQVQNQQQFMGQNQMQHLSSSQQFSPQQLQQGRFSPQQQFQLQGNYSDHQIQDDYVQHGPLSIKKKKSIISNN